MQMSVWKMNRGIWDNTNLTDHFYAFLSEMEEEDL